jgi:hypothetical protein
MSKMSANRDGDVVEEVLEPNGPRVKAGDGHRIFAFVELLAFAASRIGLMGILALAVIFYLIDRVIGTSVILLALTAIAVIGLPVLWILTKDARNAMIAEGQGGPESEGGNGTRGAEGGDGSAPHSDASEREPGGHEG